MIRKFLIIAVTLTIVFIIYILSPLMPIKKWNLDDNSGYILGHQPQTTTEANFVIDKGYLRYKSDTLGQNTELILTGNNPYIDCNSGFWDCYVSNYILKGEIIEKKQISGDTYYIFKVKEYYYTDYLPRIFNINFYLTSCILIFLISLSIYFTIKLRIQRNNV